MRRVYLSNPPALPSPEDWPVPAGLITREVDGETGRLASELCPKDRAYTEFFVPGTEPTEACDAGAGLFGGAGIRAPVDSPLALPDSAHKPPAPKPNPKMKF